MSIESNTPYLTASLDARVLTITLNRPDAMNALRPEMLAGLGELFSTAGERDDVSVIVLQGAGRAFSAGVDLKLLQGIDPAAGKIGDAFDLPAEQMVAAMRALPVPIIARVHGACFTGALEIALHCDFIYTTSDTKFGDTHTKFGLRPTWGMPQTLSRAVGVRRAKELSFSAQTFSGADAAAWGLANASFDSLEALDDALAALTKKIAGNSAGAVAAMRDMYRIAEQELGVELGLATENDKSYPAITDTNERLAGFGRS